MKYLLGYDIGSSSVKASLVDATTGQTIAQAFYPEKEAPIKAIHTGWAEQNPEDWWHYLCEATHLLLSTVHCPLSSIKAIGLSYQMHGLVCVDKSGQLLRDAIIWCDSRATQYGTNFTAGKLRWVKDNEPDLYARIYKILLPGDYIAYRLTGQMATTNSGISEMDWQEHLDLDQGLLPDLVPTFGPQGRVTASAAAELGIPADIPISYRAGDQPNNALSLNVMRPGEIAATGGTSGVVYGVTKSSTADPLLRVNNFIHVNGLTGVLLCINGAGIMNAWMKRTVAPEGMTYPEMSEAIKTIPIGSEGLSIIPFGNGAERVMQNNELGCSIHGINLIRHTQLHLMRAALEGIAFSFAYGIEVMQSLGLNVRTIKAGYANLFLMPVFRHTLASVTGAQIILYETNGAVGAALGAGIGAGIYQNADGALASLKQIAVEKPSSNPSKYIKAYQQWKKYLVNEEKLQQ